MKITENYLLYTESGKPVCICGNQIRTESPERDKKILQKAQVRIGEKCKWVHSGKLKYIEI